ncbi:MAG: hypothetical protein HRU38_04920 [Saccharospirillaceae bacterium]|nr:hypothetical protein [Pseudomonadales bacterium]NRB77999.1 hypothetical protein [Saccharospirillaceae bacterium]
MAYDLHIEKTNLDLEKWINFISENSDLEIQHQVEVNNPFTDEVIIMQTPNSAVAGSGTIYQFKDRDNTISITISNPKDKDIPSLKKMAIELGGVLVGDEGEEY